MEAAPGVLLAQAPSAGTGTDTGIFTATWQTEILAIVVANVTAVNKTFRLYHANEGQALTAGCALYYNAALSANNTMWLAGDVWGGGISVKTAGIIGVQSDTAGVTFSIYGVTRQAR